MSERVLSPSALRARRERERMVEAAVDDLFETPGFRSIHFSQARASKQTPGIPDRRYVARAARLAFWFEAKAAGGLWSVDQQEFAADCAMARELYFIGGTDEAYAILTALGLWDGRQLRPVSHLAQRPEAWRSEVLANLWRLERLTHWRWRETPSRRCATFRAYAERAHRDIANTGRTPRAVTSD